MTREIWGYIWKCAHCGRKQARSTLEFTEMICQPPCIQCYRPLGYMATRLQPLFGDAPVGEGT